MSSIVSGGHICQMRGRCACARSGLLSAVIWPPSSVVEIDSVRPHTWRSPRPFRRGGRDILDAGGGGYGGRRNPHPGGGGVSLLGLLSSPQPLFALAPSPPRRAPLSPPPLRARARRARASRRST